MTVLKCPKCSSNNVMTVKGDGGYVKCLNCTFSVPNGDAAAFHSESVNESKDSKQLLVEG